MVTEIRIYFEGASELREGFRIFFGGVRNLKLIAGGGRNQAIADFRKSFKNHPTALNLLLIDSEGPDTGTLFESTCRPQQIPESAKYQVFWMVECMESWFLADIEALGKYYRKDLRKALRGNPNVEEIPKREVFAKLKAATDGRYHKTRDAPHLLMAILPERVKQAAPNCRRLFDRLSPAVS